MTIWLNPTPDGLSTPPSPLKRHMIFELSLSATIRRRKHYLNRDLGHLAVKLHFNRLGLHNKHIVVLIIHATEFHF